jgi:hypothetical protein
MSLATDSNEEVQLAAIDSLAMQETDSGELAHLLDAPKLGGESEAALVGVLLKNGPPSPEVRGSLSQVLSRTEDPRLAARIRLALQAAN